MNKKERRQDTDQRILEAAQQIFAQYGYERATLTAIAKEAGVSGGLIVQNFGSKLKLFQRIIDSSHIRMHQRFNAIGGGDWRTQLTALIRMFENSTADPVMQEYLMFTSTVANSKDTPAYYIEKSVEEFKKNAVCAAMIEGQQKGEIRAGDIGFLYALFFRTVCNVELMCQKYGIEPPADEWFFNLLVK